MVPLKKVSLRFAAAVIKNRKLKDQASTENDPPDIIEKRRKQFLRVMLSPNRYLQVIITQIFKIFLSL